MAESDPNLSTTAGGLGVEVFISDPLAAVDAPEPFDASGEFVYNFFTPNERQEYTGGSGFTLNTGTGAQSRETFPRRVDIVFKPPTLISKLDLQAANSFLGDDIISLLSGGKLNLEDGIVSDKFQRLQINPDQVDKKLIDLVAGSIGEIAQEDQIPRSSSEIGFQISNAIAGVRGPIPQELIDSASAAQSNREIGETIIKYINASGQSNGQTYGSIARDRKTLERADLIAGRQETMSINRLVYDRVVTASASAVNHLLIDEINDRRTESLNVQTRAISASNSAGVSEDVHDLTITPIRFEQRTSRNRSFLIGFLVEKIEVRDDDIVEHPTMVIMGNYSGVFSDYAINYGSFFRYRIRSLCVREVSAVQEGTNLAGTAIILVGSSGESAELTVACEENVPPPEVADLRAFYDFENQAVQLTWSLPVNRQRDIKYFQVFKRRSIEESFRLVRVIDFDDSIILSTKRERYSNVIVQKTKLVNCNFSDPLNSDEREAIYAVCCVDAHGLTSGYSEQIGATFVRARNALSTRLVSRSGAPKTYPNLYLAEDTFADVVRVSGYRSLMTIFDPEAIVVETGSATLRASNDVASESTFTISLINEDSGLSASVVIKSGKLSAENIFAVSNITGDPDRAILEQEIIRETSIS